MKILLVENERILSEKIENFLKSEGHWCETYPSPEPALLSASFHYFDAIVFNLTQLDQAEQDLLTLLRSSNLDKKTILTYENNTMADDHTVSSLNMTSLKKPYLLSALLSQIKSILNFESRAGGDVIIFNEMIIDVPGRVVRVKGLAVNLTRREYDLLTYFIMNKNKVLSKNTIAHYFAYAEAESLSDFGFLYAHIKNLKKKLKAAGCNDYIKTVYGIGYRLEE